MQGVKLLQWKFKGKSDMQILHEYSPSFLSLLCLMVMDTPGESINLDLPLPYGNLHLNELLIFRWQTRNV